METYDPKDVQVVVANTTITGFADGTFVKVEKNADNFTPYIGAQGEVSYAENADKTGKITVTVKSTSPSYLFLVKKANEKSVYPVNVVDKNTGLSHGGTECRIMKPADSEFGKDVTAREFSIYVAELIQA